MLGHALGMATVTIVVGHSQRGTFCEALGDAYKRGAQRAGHVAELFVLSKMQFDPILHEGYRRGQTLEPDLAAASRAMKASDHLVIIFPLWCGGMPALLKGFIERILQPELIALQKAGAEPSLNLGIFKHTSARVIVTMGMPSFVYRFFYGAHALKMLKRNILHFIGVRPVRSTIIGSVENSADKRHAWLRQVEEMGATAG